MTARAPAAAAPTSSARARRSASPAHRRQNARDIAIGLSGCGAAGCAPAPRAPPVRRSCRPRNARSAPLTNARARQYCTLNLASRRRADRAGWCARTASDGFAIQCGSTIAGVRSFSRTNINIASTAGCVLPQHGYCLIASPGSTMSQGEPHSRDDRIDSEIALAVEHAQKALPVFDRVGRGGEILRRQQRRIQSVARGLANMQRFRHRAEIRLQARRKTSRPVPVPARFSPPTGRAVSRKPRWRRTRRGSRSDASLSRNDGN